MAEKKARRTQEEKAMNGARFDLIQKLESSYAEPPPYSAQAPSSQSPRSNGAGSIGELNFLPNPLEIPTPAECITHLKLLHAFAKLRHDVGNTDGLYGISLDTEKKGEEHVDSNDGTPDAGSQQPQGVHGADGMVPSQEEEEAIKLNAALAERIRDKRWAIFVHKAVARYESWWETHRATSETFSQPIKIINFSSTYDYGQINGFTTLGLGLEHNPNFKLPPLDVLMVWHSHMLNPRNYLEDCIRHTRHTLWRTSFPWKRIHDSIDDSSYEYTQSDTFTFMNLTGHRWDPLRDEGLKRLTCPKCTAVNRVPWTQPPEKCSPAALEAYLTTDTGFSGPSFSSACLTCGFTLTHEKLRVGKFIEDADAVLKFGRPLAGTILTDWGVPGVTGKGKDITTHDPFFPNRVVQKSTDFDPFALRGTVDQLTVDRLRNLFEYTIKNSLGLALINSGQNKPDFVAKESRVAVRKVLSHYWDNSSIHSLDLVGAVLRQGSFIQKMKKLDWLHSPSLMTTAQRLIIKYHRMIQLAADNPKKTVVPTLDVDLAWHTHQLTPRIYTSYTLSELKRLLNHDDKLPSSTLHSAFTWTAQAYEKRYGQPYAECSCWYCECTREPLRSSFLSKLSSRRSSISVSNLDDKGFSKSAHEGVHVSAHSALPVGTDARSAVERRRELEELDLQYAKVLKRYQKEKKADAPPKKDDRDAYVYGAYGYPVIYPMPVYVPYGADPSCTEHAHDKSGGGGSGGCAAGTCCPSTSLGACAGGEGTPGCKASCGGHGNADGGCGSCGGDGGGCGGCGG